MNLNFAEIWNIKRPKLLMNAAKQLACQNLEYYENSQTMDEIVLKNLMDQEQAIEEARRQNDWKYKAEDHIVLLAQLICCAAEFSKSHHKSMVS